MAIKIYSKKAMHNSQVETIRDIITMYQSAQHCNVIRLEDYFESREYFYLCLELETSVTLERYL